MTVQRLLMMFVLCCSIPGFVMAQDDMAGASDHPEFPRIAGSVIAGYAPTSFDEGAHIKGTPDDFTVEYAAGDVTKIMYLLPLDQSPASAFLNYETAFNALGEFEPYFTCRRGECDKNLGGKFVWKKAHRFDTIFINPATYFFEYAQNRINQVYLAGQVTAASGVYDVAMYAAEAPKTNREFTGGQTVVVLQIVKSEKFEAELEIVAASEINSEISQSGHVTLYGLFFETDSDVLIDTSKPALDEVAAFLSASPDVNVYVVGHTDNVGDVAYNQDLSLRRANAISQNLARDYGIDEGRILPLGAGLAAPVSTNKTEEGRALNRRVELVERGR
ncbi:OmpA family protein [Actibacterium sp. 188UL27-1]|uniref:OmpA family protein n=1 Tax=Actibacterium sp. 188UL27-1 TaxID=2786961 RepID=UPI00195A904D|nr:OmpA family protein [Actibacterium sp. 188UL27-1]MBM7068786.1 OmpA family protein [Actibacterium sp. 188UL27-1]